MNIVSLPVDGIDNCILVDSNQKKTCLSVNVSGVGQSTLQGVTLEGEGEGVVPNHSAILEQSQDLMTQHLNGTRALEEKDAEHGPSTTKAN